MYVDHAFSISDDENRVHGKQQQQATDKRYRSRRFSYRRRLSDVLQSDRR